LFSLLFERKGETRRDGIRAFIKCRFAYGVYDITCMAYESSREEKTRQEKS
jgi:hypothetical protein